MNKSRKFIQFLVVVSFSILIGCKSDQKENSINKKADDKKEEKKNTTKRDKSVSLIDQVDINNPEFRATVPKESFNTMVFLGTRTLGEKEEDLKMKLFMWEDKVRGYYQTFKGKTNIQIFGYIDGTEIALKSKNDEMPQEGGASITGTLEGGRLDLIYKKGTVGEDAIIKMETSDVEYPLLFDRTEDLEKYGNKNK